MQTEYTDDCIMSECWLDGLTEHARRGNDGPIRRENARRKNVRQISEKLPLNYAAKLRWEK